jgi:hypothetical protein
MAISCLVCSPEETRFPGCKVSNPGSATTHSLTTNTKSTLTFTYVTFEVPRSGFAEDSSRTGLPAYTTTPPPQDECLEVLK